MPCAPIELQDRDFLVLRGLFESRVMTTDHVAVLYFEGKGEAAKKRLQRLKSVGVITERPRQAFGPSILLLTRGGLEILQERGVLAQYPAFDLPALDRRSRVSDLTIRHELAVIDVKVAFHRACKAMPPFSIAEFSTWPLLNEFKLRRPGTGGVETTVKPDGFMRIHEKALEGNLFERAFFLEVDRSTETQETLAAKAACYLNYYRSGGFAARHGASREDFKRFPFRVLMVFKTTERRNNTAVRLLQGNPPILRMAYLTTLEDAKNDPFGLVWMRPLDYQSATAGTPFATERQTTTWG
jgi:hypothetical protein